MEARNPRNRCAICGQEAPVTKTPGPASVKIIQAYNRNYKGAPLCPKCFDRAKKRAAEFAALERSNRENQTPNTSSSGSLGVVRPETEPTSADSRTERGDSLLAQKGTQTTKSFSQPIGSRESSRENAVPPFLPENAQQVDSLVTRAHAQEPSSAESSEIPARLEIFTPTDELLQEETRKRSPERNVSPASSRRKRPRVEVSDIQEIEEREEDGPPENVVQQIIEDREEALPAADVAEEDEEDEEVEISVASSTAPLPRNPRIREEELRVIMERNQTLVNRGQGVVNNMPRTHAG